MSNVTLTIAGRQYAVACAAGEEAHVRNLGQIIDGKLQTMPNAAAQTETRNLLFAALLLADDVHEQRQGGQGAAAPAPDTPEDARLAEKLEALAIRLENCASALEG
jgi:cell division protein ZapA